MNIGTSSFRQLEKTFSTLSPLEQKFRSALRFFREQTEQTFNSASKDITDESIVIRLFEPKEIVDLRVCLDLITNQCSRRERNETIIIEKMQDFINAIGIKQIVWSDIKDALNNNDVSSLLDQNTTVVQG